MAEVVAIPTTSYMSLDSLRHENDRNLHVAANRAVMAHYQQLRSIISHTTAKLNGGVSKHELGTTLDQLEQVADGFGDYLSLQLEPGYWNELRSDDSTVATEALAIPEILELILVHVDHWDLVNMRTVNRTARDIIDASLELQAGMYLKGVKPAGLPQFHHETVFSDITREGFDVDSSYRSIMMSPKPEYHYLFGDVIAHFVLSMSTGRLPIIGDNWKRMLICQPPVKQMRASKQCALHGYVPDANDVLVESETGLTIGHLYECAKQLLAVRTTGTCMDRSGFGLWDLTFSCGDNGPPCETSSIHFKTEMIEVNEQR